MKRKYSKTGDLHIGFTKKGVWFNSVGILLSLVLIVISTQAFNKWIALFIPLVLSLGFQAVLFFLSKKKIKKSTYKKWTGNTIPGFILAGMTISPLFGAILYFILRLLSNSAQWLMNLIG
jgi:hypothetical protein